MAKRREDWQSSFFPNKKKKCKEENNVLDKFKEVNNFKIEHINNYKSPFRYTAPIQLGGFSMDSKNNFCDNFSQMRYLYIPPMCKTTQSDAGRRVWTGFPMDLNEGFEKYVGIYNDTENEYDKLLRWVCEHRAEVENMDSFKKEILFISHRSALAQVMTTMYEKFNDWMIYATKFRSVIYLNRIETEKKIQDEASLTDEQRRMISWGHKFEQYITSDSPDSEPNTSLPVNVNERYYAITIGKLGNHNLLLSAETDAMDPKVDSNDAKSMSQFVEIKTYRLLEKKRQNSFRWKLLRWYLQSYIAGIPRLICGFKNTEGIVQEMKEYNVSDLPKEAKGFWSPDVCLNFGSHFLKFVEQRVVKDDPKVVYKFYWKPGRSEITCEELSPKYQFLPEWYIEKMSTLSN